MKRTPKAANTVVAETELPTTALWPDDFAKPRETLMALGCVVAWALILTILAASNSLLPLKQALLVLAGARQQPLLSGEALHSMDIAIVLFGGLLVVVGGYIHISVGLAVVFALRPWLDGYTYPGDNTYFLWAIVYLTGLWGLRQYRACRPFRGALPLSILALYIGWCALGSLTAIQRNTTYIDLLLWLGYGATLLVTLNATNSPAARGVALAGLLAGVAGQALFAFPHLNYVLPWLRQALQSDPELLARWFKGVTEFTPELARRFNLNRAFASMVFPNALAALLLLGIAPTAALAVDGWRRLRAWPTDAVLASGERRYLPLLMGAVPLYVLCALIPFAWGMLGLIYGLQSTPWYGPTGRLGLLCGLGALLPAILFLCLGRSRGIRYALNALMTALACVFAPLMLGALWISYSRGAMLALCVSGLLIGGLLLFQYRTRHKQRPPAKLRLRLLALVLVGLGVATAGILNATAATEPVTPPSSHVSSEGMDVTFADLSNPASFSARTGYWRVALRMVRENPWLGVGLGNFGLAYGPLQDLDAGDVRNAHSMVLQTVCEAGFPGLLLFMAFWIGFAWKVGQRLSQQRGQSNWYTVGLAVGLGAFLIHALIDISFSHPSLLMMAMGTLGIFYSALPDKEQPRRTQPRRIGAVLLIGLSTLAAGLMMRPYFQTLGMNGGRFINVSSREWGDTRREAARTLVVKSYQWGQTDRSGPPPNLPLAQMASLIPEREEIFRLGRVLYPDREQKRWVVVAPEEALPRDGVVEILRPWDTAEVVRARIESWILELRYLDGRFPYDPEQALLISQLYQLLAEWPFAPQAARNDEFLAETEAWALEAVRRSPQHKDMHQNLAWVYWFVASRQQGQVSIDYYRKALGAFKRSRELGHLEPDYYFAEAGALDALGQSYANQGLQEAADGYLEQGKSLREAGLSLQQDRWRRGLQ